MAMLMTQLRPNQTEQVVNTVASETCDSMRVPTTTRALRGTRKMVMMDDWSLSSMYLDRMVAEQANQHPTQPSKSRKAAKVGRKASVSTGTVTAAADRKVTSTVAHSTPSAVVRGPKSMPPRVMHTMKAAKTSPSGGTEVFTTRPSIRSTWEVGAT